MPPSDLVPTPAVCVSEPALERNLQGMQDVCTRAGVELWPHVKTHKMVPILRRQLELGAAGATCAKIGEAESLLSSGVRRIFVAHSLAGLHQAPRLKELAARLDELIVAVTSPLHCDALEAILESADVRLPVMLAIDTGLEREGARSPETAVALAGRVRRSTRMELRGLYTHEGHAYQAKPGDFLEETVARAHAVLCHAADAIGGDLSLWPGCSVTAARFAGLPRVRAVRPGSYVFGDLSLTETTGVMDPGHVALTVLATVVDRPTETLALIDAGSKVFSSDRAASGIFARCVEHPEIVVHRLSEEHGFLGGDGVTDLLPGDRLHFVPAHVCPVVNLATRVCLVSAHGGRSWLPVDARGRSD